MAEAYGCILEKCKRTLLRNAADRAVVEKRAAAIGARYFLEKGEAKIEERQFEKARELLREAKVYLHSSTLGLAVLGLGIAPVATTRLMSFWKWIRNGAAA